MGKAKHYKHKLAGTFYNSARLNDMALTLQKSFDEVKGVLEGKNKTKRKEK